MQLVQHNFDRLGYGKADFGGMANAVAAGLSLSKKVLNAAGSSLKIVFTGSKV